MGTHAVQPEERPRDVAGDEARKERRPEKAPKRQKKGTPEGAIRRHVTTQRLMKTRPWNPACNESRGAGCGLTHVEGAPIAVAMELPNTHGSQQRAALMKRTTIDAALDVHQATTLASVRDDRRRVIARTILQTEEPALGELFQGMNRSSNVSRRRDQLRLRRRMTGARARSASFTASESGNTSITDGSRTTMFVPSPYRTAVTPRTPLEKSYSGRMVSGSASRTCFLPFPFFIILALAVGGESCADDSCSRRPSRRTRATRAMPA